MSYAEELFKLRKRIVDAAVSGVVDDNSKTIVEALLIQIMNDGEKNRQQCVSQAENLRKQAATLDGQAGAFASITSIVYNVLNGFIHSAELSKEDDKRIEEENKEKSQYIAENSDGNIKAVKKPQGKKKK